MLAPEVNVRSSAGLSSVFVVPRSGMTMFVFVGPCEYALLRNMANSRKAKVVCKSSAALIFLESIADCLNAALCASPASANAILVS
jgi:hypothetical protein